MTDHIPAEIATGYRVFTGPSHAARLRNCIRTGQLHGFGFDVAGVGGMPIWSKRMDGFCADRGASFHMVGDFRFGNAILDASSDPLVIGSGSEERLGIRKHLISAGNDRILYQAALHRLDRLIAERKNDRLLFWDLTIREAEARRTGRYRSADGTFSHPTWNLSEVLSRFPENAIDTRDILSNAAGLFMDSSAHPSFLGWHYILGKCLGSNVVPAKLSEEYRASLGEVWRYLRPAEPIEKVVLCGNSKFTRILEDFVQRGSFFLPDWIELKPRYDKAIDRPDRWHIFFPAEQGAAELGTELAAVEATFGFRLIKSLRSTKCHVVPYDHWAAACVQERAALKNSLPERDTRIAPSQIERSLQMRLPAGADVVSLSEISRYGGMIELSNTLHPTVMGIIKILALVLTGCDEDQSEEYFLLLRDRMARACLTGG